MRLSDIQAVAGLAEEGFEDIYPLKWQ